jgi:hypothetical protein
MEHTYDSVGQKKEVIVIDDSESPHHAANKPVTRKRTRAQAAAEAAALSQQSSQTNGHYAPSTVNGGGSSTSGSAKKRKVDDPYDIPAKKTTKPKASGVSAPDLLRSSFALTSLLFHLLDCRLDVHPDIGDTASSGTRCAWRTSSTAMGRL